MASKTTPNSHISSTSYPVTPAAISEAERLLYDNLDVTQEIQPVTGEKHYNLELTLNEDLIGYFEESGQPESTDTPDHQVEEGIGLALGTAIGYLLNKEERRAYRKIEAEDILEEKKEELPEIDEEAFKTGFDDPSDVLGEVVSRSAKSKSVFCREEKRVRFGTVGWPLGRVGSPHKEWKVSTETQIEQIENSLFILSALAGEADNYDIEAGLEETFEYAEDAYGHIQKGESILEELISKRSSLLSSPSSEKEQEAREAYEGAQMEIDNAQNSFESVVSELDTERPLLQPSVDMVEEILEYWEEGIDEIIEEEL